MQLSVKDLSKLLNITERTVYRWIKKQMIPFYRVQDQYRFNRREILDWATGKKVDVSQGILKDENDLDIPEISLSETIKKGGIYYRVEGSDKKSLLKSVVNLLNLPDDADKKELLNAMLLREELGSTGFGDGIAIPHARYPVVTHIPQPVVSVSFLEEPLNYGAIDGKPVHCLFTLVSPSVRSHLKIFSKIAFILRDTNVKDVIVHQRSREVILNEIERAEKSLIS